MTPVPQNTPAPNALVPAASLPEPFRTWGGTCTNYSREKTVASLFEEIARDYPDNVALVCQQIRLTYSQLNTQANRLAHHLMRMGVGPEVMVGCCIERSPEVIVAFLAILKAGGAYVPLDPSYPRQRLDFLLNDARAPVILTKTSVTATLFANSDLPLINVDEIDLGSSSLDDLNPHRSSAPETLAYVMYTSGSTGQPKGVMVENRAIVRLVRNTNYCRFGPDEVTLQFAPTSFDASTFEIWGALLNGGRLVLMPPHETSLANLARVIHQEGVTTLWLTAGLFSLMVEQRLEDLRPIRQLLAGGDVLSPSHVHLCLERLPDTSLINGYGPTENTTFTCCHVMHPGDLITDTVPIGKPISNTRIFILDEQLHPVPVGQAGELYAAGDGLARGYLNDPQATAVKFVPNPFGQEEDERMYRSGDLARWRQDGTVEFLGRLDDQVKILGHRVEPGEIEIALVKHPGVKQVCVVPRAEHSGANRLVAFYLPSTNPGPTPVELREFAAETLPDFMVPANFVQLISFPLSANGKIDRHALAKLEITTTHAAISPEQPKTQLETLLVEMWQRVLRVPRVGLDDNFFDIGGDSLLLMSLHSNLQKAFHSEISVTDLFEFTTIRKLAQHLLEKQTVEPPFAESQMHGQRQREAFARLRELRQGSDL